MTQRASWIDLSASSSTSLLLPLMMMEQGLPGVAIPVIFTHLELPVCISSTRSALARFSAVKWSREAIGRQPMVLHQLVAAPDDDGTGFAGRRHPSDLHALRATRLHLLHQISAGKVLRSEVVKGGNWPAADGLAQEVNVLSLNVLHDHNLHLVKEMDSQVGKSIPENRLLDEQNIAASLLHLLHYVEDVCALLTKHPIHGGVVGHYHLVVHVGLWWRHTELDEANLSFLHPFWTIDVGRLLLKDHPVHQLSVVNGATKLLDDLDVFQVDVVLPGRVDHFQHSIHSNGAEFGAVL